MVRLNTDWTPTGRSIGQSSLGHRSRASHLLAPETAKGEGTVSTAWCRQVGVGMVCADVAKAVDHSAAFATEATNPEGSAWCKGPRKRSPLGSSPRHPVGRPRGWQPRVASILEGVGNGVAVTFAQRSGLNIFHHDKYNAAIGARLDFHLARNPSVPPLQASEFLHAYAATVGSRILETGSLWR